MDINNALKNNGDSEKTEACAEKQKATFTNLPLDVLARALAVMGMIGVGFLLFTLFTSNPFERVLPNSPLDGQDLNPLLQDIGLIIHPSISINMLTI